MPDVRQLEIMAEIAHLYYEEDYSQSDIARMMNISHSTISRILKKAKESGVVKIVIRYPLPSVPSLESELKARFGLKQVRVFPASDMDYAELIRNVGQLAARTIESMISNGMIFSISLGSAVEATIKALRPIHPVQCRIAMLMGATEDDPTQGTSPVQLLASICGGDLKIIPSPWLFKNAEICRILLQEPAVREAIEIGESSDLALVGIGCLDPQLSFIIRSNYIIPDEIKELKKMGAVGEIFGKFYDINGNLLDIEFNRRSVTIDIRRLRNIPTVIGVAVGAQKAEAIIGAVRGKFINVLVTDSNAATRLLELDGKKRRTSS